MKSSKNPIWKRSILADMSYIGITTYLEEIGGNGDPCGYGSEEDGYYQEYKDEFDELSLGAYNLMDAINEWDYPCDSSLREIWDDMTVTLLGYQEKVLGFDEIEADYYQMIGCYEDAAVQEAEKRLLRFTKSQLIKNFRRVLTTLMLFWDIKASHDCLTAVVEELDERGAIMSAKNQEIDRLYEDLTGKNSKEFDEIIANLPQRMWVE